MMLNHLNLGFHILFYLHYFLDSSNWQFLMLVYFSVSVLKPYFYYSFSLKDLKTETESIWSIFFCCFFQNSFKISAEFNSHVVFIWSGIVFIAFGYQDYLYNICTYVMINDKLLAGIAIFWKRLDSIFWEGIFSSTKKDLF